MSEWKVSQRRACGVLQLDPTSYRYKSRRPAQAVLEAKIKEICQTRVRYGYRRVHVLLRREGWIINKKKTQRIYRELGLQLRAKTPKRRVKAKLRDDRKDASHAHETWAIIEAFNGRLRAECLNTHWFLSLDDARRKLEDWRREYNEVRPHGAIGNKAPITLLDRAFITSRTTRSKRENSGSQ